MVDNLADRRSPRATYPSGLRITHQKQMNKRRRFNRICAFFQLKTHLPDRMNNLLWLHLIDAYDGIAASSRKGI